VTENIAADTPRALLCDILAQAHDWRERQGLEWQPADREMRDLIEERLESPDTPEACLLDTLTVIVNRAQGKMLAPEPAALFARAQALLLAADVPGPGSCCEECPCPLTPGQLRLSLAKYGRPLCPRHQHGAVARQADPAAKAEQMDIDDDLSRLDDPYVE
jgi:hypothetical protein